MTTNSQFLVSRTRAIVVVLAVFIAGAGSMYLLLRASAPGPQSDASMSNRMTAGQPSSPTSSNATTPSMTVPAPSEVVVSLSPEAVARAGIEVVTVGQATSRQGLQLPAVIEANAYKQVTVTPLVGGRITRVSVALGDTVRPGQTLAQIYSPELAEAQTRYVAQQAQLEAVDQQLRRTERLTEIGAASRQELEKVRADRTTLTTEIAGARARLILLGMAPDAITKLASAGDVAATMSVTAPVAGVILERDANVGLNVDPSTKLFTVSDLSTVWVVGNLYEKDFAAVQVGKVAVITSPAYPGLALDGRVSYIDPQVNAETRTARVRVEVPNPRGQLRLGMYAHMRLESNADRRAATVPRAAVQTVGSRQVVYLANPTQPGRYTERAVILGGVTGDQVEVVSGLEPGDAVVAKGSFFVRAERDRLGLQGPPDAALTPDARAVAPGPEPAPSVGRDTRNAGVQTARVTVGDEAFSPAQLTFRAGVRARLTFVRTSEKTCATVVVFPSLNITRDLPLNQEVTIDFTPSKTGEIGFVCGMNMLSGTVVVQ